MTISTDAVIIGAGPCGLFQVFELGLHGLKAEVIDTMREVGGQCVELYPDKPIYDIPAVPVCSAQELVERLLEQIAPFEPGFHLNQEVTEVIGDGSGPFTVRTSAGTEFSAKTVIIAGGVGSFQPRRLRAENLSAEGHPNLHYRVRDPSKFDDRNVVILGGGDSALDWVLELLPRVRSLTQVHRSATYRAAPASVEKMKQAVAARRMTVHEFSKVERVHLDGERITSIDLHRAKQDDEISLELDDLLVFFGLAPKLGPIADWGLELQRKALVVDTEKFQTSVPGIFAVGDINTYPGKKKLILSGFHEAALAAVAVRQHIEPGKKVHLQYTTTSPLIHERLGVDEKAADASSG